MKKVLISLAILGTFIVYSLGIRHELPVVSKPLSLGSNTPTITSTGNTPSARSSGLSTPLASTSAQYKNGNYQGVVADAYYGNVQVAVTISNGSITDVKFLQHPDSHPTSVVINEQAMPFLQQETIKAQSANVQIVSGATFTSQAFIQSLNSALAQAQA